MAAITSKNSRTTSQTNRTAECYQFTMRETRSHDIGLQAWATRAAELPVYTDANVMRFSLYQYY